MTTKTADLRYTAQLFHSRDRWLAIEFDHADNDRFIRVAWLPFNYPLNPWSIKQHILDHGQDAATYNIDADAPLVAYSKPHPFIA